MIRLPWRVQNLADKIISAGHYYANRMRGRRLSGSRILFCVPFYGYTGGAFAVLSAANLLSESCEVSFLTKASNVMNRYVSPKVRMVSEVTGPYDFCVIESGVDPAIVSQRAIGAVRSSRLVRGSIAPGPSIRIMGKGRRASRVGHRPARSARRGRVRVGRAAEDGSNPLAAFL